MKVAQPITPQREQTHMQRLLNKYGISLEMLRECMSPEVQYDSKTTLHRMVLGTCSEELSAELRPVAARCLSRFLTKKGLNKSEVDAELTAIFNKGEYQPMSFQRIRLTRPELQFFGLPEDPFKNDPQSFDEVYFPPAYREIFDTVIDAAKYRHFVAVLGPVGSSKSTIQDCLRDHITKQTSLKILWPEFYNQAQLTPMEIGQSILRSLGVQRIPARATKLASTVTDQLRAVTQEGNRAAMIIDNCHELQKPAVRSLKKFIEMSSGGFQRYFGIVLFGWPEFETMLKDPTFAEIYERIHVVHMPAFGPLAAGYLAKRFDNLGLKLADFFDEEAVEFIAENAETPLACGNIANRAIRYMIEDFQEKKVKGLALRSVMFFDRKPTAEPGFKKRQAA